MELNISLVSCVVQNVVAYLNQMRLELAKFGITALNAQYAIGANEVVIAK